MAQGLVLEYPEGEVVVAYDEKAPGVVKFGVFFKDDDEPVIEFAVPLVTFQLFFAGLL